MPQMISRVSVTVSPPAVSGYQRRSAARLDVGLPVTLDSGVESQTHDFSAGGLSFESATPLAQGSMVALTVHYCLDGHNFPMECEAQVMHCAPHGSAFLIGARTLKPFFEPLA